MVMNMLFRKILFATSIFWLFSVLSVVHSDNTTINIPNKAVFLSIEGAIGPATKDYFIRSLEKANKRNAALLIVQLNTPGGLDSSMRDIIQAILSSRIPVVTYVTPSGARAASAGTYILYASHIAAMAPATNLGAATPVQIGGIPSPDKDGKNPDKKTDDQAPADNQSTMSRKAINDAVAYIRGLAELRGRNVEWAEKAVREAASLSATQALQENVIDIIATDLSDLLKQLDGRKIKTQQQEVVLNTQGMVLEQIDPDWRNRLLSILTDPNVAYILMLIGIYGLIFEFSNPGALIPGTVGAICLLLALFAFQALPINYAGFALIILGITFMIAEAFLPSFGALGIGGVVAFVIGSIILIDTDVPGFGVSLPLIATFGFISSVLFAIVVVMALKARRRPVVSGQEELVGAIAEAIEDFDQNGYVNLHSENWNAITTVPIKKGQKVKVTKIEGLTLYVEPHQDIHEEEAQ